VQSIGSVGIILGNPIVGRYLADVAFGVQFFLLLSCAALECLFKRFFLSDRNLSLKSWKFPLSLPV